MRMDKLTTKFQLALQDGQSLAVGRDHQFIEPVHVMVALLDQEGGTVRHLLQATGEAFEDGTLNYLSIAAITTGLDFLDEVGMEHINQHNHLRTLEQSLSSRTSQEVLTV